MKIPAAKIHFPEEDRKELPKQLDEVLESGQLTLEKEFEERFDIAVITEPFNSRAGEQNLAYLIQTLEPLSGKIIAITGNLPEYPNNKVKIIRLKCWQKGKHSSASFKMLANMLTDLQISFNLLRVFRDIDIVSFQIGARAYPLSVLLSKILRKKVVVFSFNTFYKLTKVGKEHGVFDKKEIFSYSLANIVEKFAFLLADQIAVESESVIKFSNIEKYRRKISIYGAQFIDLDLFKIKKELKDREELVGYIGRLDKVKGVLNLAKAIPLILRSHNNIEFLIGGDGVLFDDVVEELKSKGVYDRVRLIGEIPHEEVPNYLNEMKLLILPSYSEGIPGIVQEAMACGTPVLATPVGGVPDLIKDGKTGFIMGNNSSECIAENVIRALEHPNLEEIVENGREFIERKYSYEVMVRKCRDSLEELMKGK